MSNRIAGAPCGIEIGRLPINAALVNPNDSAVLCQDAVILLDGPVEFTAPGQQLSTQGLPISGLASQTGFDFGSTSRCLRTLDSSPHFDAQVVLHVGRWCSNEKSRHRAGS